MEECNPISDLSMEISLVFTVLTAYKAGPISHAEKDAIWEVLLFQLGFSESYNVSTELH